MKKISYIFIIAGILVASYPIANNLYGWYWQQRLISEFESTEITVQEDYLEEQYQQLNEIFVEEIENPSIEEEIIEEEITEEAVEKQTPQPQQNLMGTIEIPKINLKITVAQGTSQSTLRRGAGHITGTNLLGEVGNSAVAAHRAHTYGRFFNRLDEMEVGDLIIVNTKEGKLKYTVYEKKIVEPTDLSVLNRNNQDRVLTLITCDPLYDATHRLIIHAVM